MTVHFIFPEGHKYSDYRILNNHYIQFDLNYENNFKEKSNCYHTHQNFSNTHLEFQNVIIFIFWTHQILFNKHPLYSYKKNGLKSELKWIYIIITIT